MKYKVFVYFHGPSFLSFNLDSRDQVDEIREATENDKIKWFYIDETFIQKSNVCFIKIKEDHNE